MKLIEAVTEQWKGKKLIGSSQTKAEKQTRDVLVALATVLVTERASFGNELGRWLMERLSK